MAHGSREKKAREGESRGGKKAHSKRASRGGVKSAKCVPYFRDKEGQFQLAVSRKRAFKSKNMPVSGKRKEGLAKPPMSCRVTNVLGKYFRFSSPRSFKCDHCRVTIVSDRSHEIQPHSHAGVFVLQLEG